MSNIIADLNEIKEKIDTMHLDEIINSKGDPKEVQRQEKEQRLKNKMNDYFNKTNLITFNIGGQLLFKINLSVIEKFKYYLDFKSEIREGIVVYLDMNINVFDVIFEIIRINPDSKSKNNIITYENLVIIDYYGESIFKDDWKFLKTRVNIIQYNKTTKTFVYPNNDKSKSKKMLNYWREQANVLCYICGKPNDGKFWKIKYSNTSRNDKFVIDGCYAACLNCDSLGESKY
jgi:hypothetical protein